MAHFDRADTAASGRTAGILVALPKQSNGGHAIGLHPAAASLPDHAAGDHTLHLSESDWLALSQRLDISPQERKVVQGILSGQKLTTLAEEMNLGLGTVKTYCQRIYHKLNISTHCELALAVLAAHRASSPRQKSPRVIHGDDSHTADLMNGGGI